MLLYLKGAVAKDFGEDRCREEGDDRQEDCYDGCDDDRNDNIDYDEICSHKHIYTYVIKKQTHDKTSRLRDMATLLVLTMWTLYNCVAPGHDHDGDDVGDHDWSSPDGPHGEELAGLVLLIADVQRHASAHVVVTSWKGSFSPILVLAALFVFSVLAL